MRNRPQTLRELKAALVGDSRERARLMTKLIEQVRIEEREKVLRITEKARVRAEDR